MNKILLLKRGELGEIVERNLRRYDLRSLDCSTDINKIDMEADLIISAGYDKRILKPLGVIPCFNIHLSPLPRYAGFNPFYWAIKNDEKEWAITLHEAVLSFDTGDIVSQPQFPISLGDTARSLYDRALSHVEPMLNNSIELILSGSFPRMKQDLTKRTYYKKESVNYSQPVIFDDSQESWKEIRARYFPPFELPKIEVKK
jgi:methionyl-tRNA formyltransferase